MEWLQPVDGYCERLGAGLWAEPFNAVTNLAFLIAAAVMAWRCRGQPRGQVLAAMLALIGIGSGLFHTFANRLTGAMDDAAIIGFILPYLYAANRDFLGLPRIWALVATAAFLPYAALTVPLWLQITVLGSSAVYMPVPVLILAYALILGRSAPATARGLLIGVTLLMVSLAARMLDAPLCAQWPRGTHFLWHVLNALMLAWMIEVWRRHVLARLSPRG